MARHRRGGPRGSAPRARSSRSFSSRTAVEPDLSLSSSFQPGAGHRATPQSEVGEHSTLVGYPGLMIDAEDRPAFLACRSCPPHASRRTETHRSGPPAAIVGVLAAVLLRRTGSVWPGIA